VTGGDHVKDVVQIISRHGGEGEWVTIGRWDNPMPSTYPELPKVVGAFCKWWGLLGLGLRLVLPFCTIDH
jgi:hypothetical protein